MPLLAVFADRGYAGGAQQTMRQVAAVVIAVVITSSGHYILEDQPKALTRELMSFSALIACGA